MVRQSQRIRMSYDHNQKAGNPGDVIKHVALIAALVSSDRNENIFRFVDLFAGYAYNPLDVGNEWREGIGRIAKPSKTNSNLAVQLYLDWYLSRPSLVGGTYPGSSLVAVDVMAYLGKRIDLTLFDISEKPIRNLRRVYGSDNHTIHHRAARLDDPEIARADFLFVDPPGIQSSRKPSYPTLNELKEFAELPENCQTLFWLPLTNSATENDAARHSLLSCGYELTQAVWANQGNMVGCVLGYRLASKGSEALRASVAEVFDKARLGTNQSFKVEHTDA